MKFQMSTMIADDEQDVDQAASGVERKKPSAQRMSKMIAIVRSMVHSSPWFAAVTDKSRARSLTAD